MSKTFFTPHGERVVSGLGSFEEVGKYARDISGKDSPRAFVVRGRSARHDEALQQYLSQSGVSVAYLFEVDREPLLSQGQKCVDLLRSGEYDILIAIGGGSVLDMGKVAAAVAPNGNFKYLGDCTQKVTPSVELEKKSLPKIAVPTTAGSGSEATRVSVLVDDSSLIKENWEKTVVYNDELFFDVSIIDGTLSQSLPQDQTRYTAFDAFAHAMEAFTCREPKTESDEHALQAMESIIKNLPAAYRNGGDLQARQNMAEAATHAGIALANSRSGAIHGLGLPLYRRGVSHGEAVALLLPHVVEFNSTGLPADYKDYDDTMKRFRSVATLFGETDVNVGVRRLAESVELPRKILGLTEENIDGLVEEAFRLNETRLLQPSVRKVTRETAREIYLRAIRK